MTISPKPTRGLKETMTSMLPLLACTGTTAFTCVLYTCKFRIEGAISPFSSTRLIIVTLLAIISVLLCRYKKQKFFPPITSSLGMLMLALSASAVLNADVEEVLWPLFPSSVTFLAIAYLSFAISKHLAFFFWSVLLLISVIAHLMFLQTGISLSTQLLTQLFAASKDEILNVLTFQNAGLLLGATAFSILISYIIYILLRNTSKLTLFAQGCVHLLVIISFLYFSDSSIYNTRPGVFWPVSTARSILNDSISANQANDNHLNLVFSLASSADKSSASFSLNPSSDLICIIHIGESARYDRFSLNGWKNKTSPNLELLHQQGKLINFTDCSSSNWLTISAITNILTNSETYHYITPTSSSMPTCGSVTAALEKHLFKSFYIIESGSVQDKRGDSLFSSMLYAFSKGNSKLIRTELPSFNQVHVIDKIISQGNKRNLLFVINNSGSHMPFFMYDTKNPPFKPCDPTAYYRNPQENSTDRELANNAYDCTIHYTDAYIQKIVNILQGKPFIYVYISDHGEYIGHHGLWNRGHFTTPDDYFQTSGCHIPFFIIYSRELEHLHPHFAKSIQVLKDNNQIPTSHGNIFHTLLGFFGINSPFYTPEKDLSSPHVKPYEKQQNGARTPNFISAQ